MVESQERGSRSASSRAGRTLITLLLLPLALAGVELVVKVFKAAGEARKDTVSAAFMPARLKGNYRGVVMGLPFETNRYGFRGEEEFDLQPSEPEFRILALGDSVGVGLGVVAADHYSRQLESQLRQRFSEATIRVINAAGQGYSPSNYLAYLIHEGLKFEPRLVLIQIELCNDITDEALLDWSGEIGQPSFQVRGGRYVVAWDGNLMGTVARGPFSFERTYTYTLLLRRALRAISSWWPTTSPLDLEGAAYFHHGWERVVLGTETIEAGWGRLFGALEATQEFLQRRQIPLLVLLVPPRFVFQPEVPRTQEWALALLERAARQAREAGLALVSVREELGRGGGSKLYFDFAHPTAEGNRIIAEVLAARVLPLVEQL